MQTVNYDDTLNLVKGLTISQHPAQVLREPQPYKLPDGLPAQQSAMLAKILKLFNQTMAMR